PGLCDISLDAGSVFSIPTGVTKWVLNTTLTKVKVKFGATCTGSVAGRYFTFWSAKCANFYSLPPVIITLTTINKGSAVISWEGITSSTATTFPGGNLLINLSVSATDVAVDAITATFKGDTKNSGSSMSIPELKANAVKVQGKFESTDTTVTAAQKFTITINNTCFTLSLSAVTADLSATAPALTTAVDTKTWCVFKNPKTDTYITSSSPPKYNGLRWVCTPTLFPLNIFCVLYCKTGKAPAVADIIAQKGISTPLQQFTTIYFGAAKEYTLAFVGLSRGQAYTLKCIVQTTETDTKARKTSTWSVSSWIDRKDTKDLIPTAVDPTACVKFTLQGEKVPASFVSALLKFCQNVFSPGGSPPITTGCIICSDDTGATVPGSEFTKNIVCPAAAGGLRHLKTPRNLSTTAATLAPKTAVVIVCAKPDVVCATNLPGSRKLRNINVAAPLSSPIWNVLDNSVTQVLKDTKLIYAKLKVTGVTVVSVETIFEPKAPLITVTTAAAIAVDVKTGTFSVPVYYKGTSNYDCYWKINSGTATSTATALQNCGEAASKSKIADACGKVVLKSPSVSIKGIVKPTFLIGSDYCIWFVCYNKVYAQLPSRVIKIGECFKPTCSSGTIAQNRTCIIPVQSPPPAASVSGNYIYIVNAVMKMVVFIFFN
ncbi:MAG: hypothetical protein GY861_01440, partial [bacterium]|nr:hypothetical protein [bacterium]